MNENKRFTIDGAIVAMVILAVAGYIGLSYATSYQHTYVLGLTHGERGTAGRLTPLDIDIPIAVFALVALFMARQGVKLGWYHWLNLGLWGGVVATVGVNWYFGQQWGIIGAAVAAVPAAFMALAVEAAMLTLRTAAESREKALRAANLSQRGQRAAQTRKARSGAPEALGDDDQFEAAMAALPGQLPAQQSPKVPSLTGIGLSSGR